MRSLSNEQKNQVTVTISSILKPKQSIAASDDVTQESKRGALQLSQQRMLQICRIRSNNPGNQQYIIDGSTAIYSYRPWGLGYCIGDAFVTGKCDGRNLDMSIGSGGGTIKQSPLFNTVSIQTQDISLAGTTYSCTLKGTYMWDEKYETFTIQLINGCAQQTVIAPSFPLTFNYEIGSGTKTFSFSEWQTSNPACSPFTYSAKQKALNNPLPFTFSGTGSFTFNPINRQFSISNTDISKGGNTYITVVTGNAQGATLSKEILITLVNPCPAASSTIESYVPSDLTYTIGSGTQRTNSFSPWTIPLSICGPIILSLAYNNAPLPVTFTDGQISYLQATRVFQVSTNDLTLHGRSFVISITGEANGATLTKTFTISIQNGCAQSSITAPSLIDYAYTIGSGAKTFNTFSNWISNRAICTPFVYTALIDNVALPFQFPDSKFLTFDPVSKSFSIETSQFSLGGQSYTISVNGNALGAESSKQFTLTMINPCLTATVTTSTPSDFTYTIQDSLKSLPAFPQWTVSNPLCGVFEYSATWNDVSLPHIFSDTGAISFDPVSRKFSISTSVLSEGGKTYTIMLSGNANGASSTVSFKIRLALNCTQLIPTVPIIPDSDYLIGSGPLDIIFDEWTVDSGCGSFSYTASISGVDLPKSIGLNGQITLQAAQRTVTIESTDNALINSNYNVILKGNAGGAQAQTNLRIKIVLNPCLTADVIPAAMAARTYEIGTGVKTFGILQWYPDPSTLNSTCPIVITMVKELSSGLILPAFTFSGSGSLSFDSTIWKFQIENSNINLAGFSYQIQMEGFGKGLNKTRNFSLNLLNICDTYIPTSQAPANFDYEVGRSPKTVNFTSWTVPQNTACAPFTYSAMGKQSSNTTYESLTSLEGGIILFDPVKLSFIVDTDNTNLIPNSYDIELTGNAYGANSTRYFMINLVPNPCLVATISPTVLEDITYTIGSNQITKQLYDWGVSEPSCTLIYQVFDESQNSLNSDFINFNYASKQFSIYTNNTQFSDLQYRVIIQGSIDGQSTQSFFKLTLLNDCQNSMLKIDPQNFSMYSYPIGTSPMTILFKSWESSNAACSPFTYSANITVGGVDYPLDYSIPNGGSLRFDPLTLAFDIESSNSNLIGTQYYIHLFGYTYGAQSKSTLILTLTNICTTLTPTVPFISDVIYELSVTPLAIDLSGWNTTNPACFPFNYSLLIGGQQDPYLFPNNGNISIFGSNALVISSDPALDGTPYNIQVKADAFGSIGITSFTITIRNPCPTAPIFPTQIPEQTYTIGQGTFNFSFVDWSIGNPVCAPFLYTATFGIATFPLVIGNHSHFDFDKNTRSFSIIAVDPSLADSVFIITIQGVSSGGSALSYFAMKVQNPPCLVTAQSPSPQDTDTDTMQTFTYTLGEPKSSIQFHDFVQFPCTAFREYRLSILFGGKQIDQYLGSKFISVGTINEEFPSFLSANLQEELRIYVKTDDILLVKRVPYKLRVTGYALDITGAIRVITNLFIPLMIQAPNLGPPMFITQLQNLRMTAGQSRTYIFPPMYDSDGDIVSVVSIDFGNARSFVSGTFPQFSFSPNPFVNGSFTIKVTLIDSNLSPITKVYPFNLIVDPNINQGSVSGSDISWVKVDPYFDAMIVSINFKGLMKVYFSKEIIIPANFTYFNDKVLGIEVEYNIGDLKDSLVFNWTIKEISIRMMTIQLDFLNPQLVSLNVNISTLCGLGQKHFKFDVCPK